jgi:hypothetical protein
MDDHHEPPFVLYQFKEAHITHLQLVVSYNFFPPSRMLWQISLVNTKQHLLQNYTVLSTEALSTQKLRYV